MNVLQEKSRILLGRSGELAGSVRDESRPPPGADCIKIAEDGVAGKLEIILDDQAVDMLL